MVSSQVLPDFSDDEDFNVAKSQAGFPMAKKKRGISQTRVSSCHGSTPKKTNGGTPSSSTKTKKPGSSSARRMIFSNSDSNSDLEKYVFYLTVFLSRFDMGFYLPSLLSVGFPTFLMMTTSTWPSHRPDFRWQRKSGAFRELRSLHATDRLQRRQTEGHPALRQRQRNWARHRPEGSSFRTRTATLIWRSMFSILRFFTAADMGFYLPSLLTVGFASFPPGFPLLNAPLVER